MGLLSKLNAPVILKSDSSAKQELQELEQLQKSASFEQKKELEQRILSVKYGLDGENCVLYELKNSHMPMYILHDIYLKHEELTAQIDYLVITRKLVLVIECKNLYGNICINQNGDFIRFINYNGEVNQEGIYSPYTQNRRHLELIREIRKSQKNILFRASFDRNFQHYHKSIIVLANPKTIINMENAPKEIRNQITRADNLIYYIQNLHANSTVPDMSDREMKALAEFFLEKNIPNPVDYTKKYREIIDGIKSVSNQKTEVKSIFCEICGKPMTLRKGTNENFWGCTGFPNCRNTKPYATEPTVKKSKSTEVICEQCGKPMTLRKGKNGNFWGCTGFPNCRNTKPYATETTVKKSRSTEVICNQCGKPMILRKGKNGNFWGCTGYPNCKNTKNI
ncbi:MAG: topoisomerase DNA-binding C4 zinc finger domain-containing protein [Oscillospiraceae bacterium]|nr:topoisomerase DNA-binding C4 zinc finger domain-containing protein [Oscillospiraceae bacterium]